MKIINKFYILLLELADTETPLITEVLELDSETEEILYNIETILDTQEIDSQLYYLIK